MKHAKRIVALILALAMATAVAAAASGCKKDDNTDGKTYTYNTYTSVSPSNWNMLDYQDNNDTQIMNYLAGSLFEYDYKFDEKGEIIPGEYNVVYSAVTKAEDVTAAYAEKYGFKADSKGYAWKFTLRNDLKWEDGTAINAGDFVYSMKEQLNPLFQNYRADSYYNGATIIHNAQAYYKQGSALYETISNLFSGIAAAKEGGYTEIFLDKTAVESAFTEWFGAGYDKVKAAGYFAEYFSLYDAAGNKTDVNFFDKYDVSTATDGRIALTDAMMADYATCKDWEPDPDVEVALLSTVYYTYPEVKFEDVGLFVGANDYELILVLDKPTLLLKDDGSLSYIAAYNMSSLPLVKKDLYESLKTEPIQGSTVWTSGYGKDVASTSSWGPYKLTSFQSGKQYILEKNDSYYGYGLERNKGLYQTTKIVCDTISEWNTAWQEFQKGNLADISIDVTIASDYKGSARAIFTPDDFVNSVQLQADTAALKGRETAGVDKEMLTYVEFRKALSLGINRAAYTASCTTSSLAGFGLFNSMHYYDVENGLTYRSSDEAKKVLCETYGVDYTKFDSLDEAVEFITGYDLTQARALVTEAYNKALAAGTISATDKVVLTYGTSADSETVRRNYDFFDKAWKELMVGTPLEGRFELEFSAAFGTSWANDFIAGAYDVCQGGWNGAAWDPGYFLLAYLSPDYMYSMSWDTSKAMLTLKGLTMNGTPINEGKEVTMDLISWYDCLNGNDGCKYDLSANAVPQSERLPLIAALEKEVLTVYYTVPVANRFTAELLSYKVEYKSREYNTFMTYGGLQYMTYNYDDAGWTEYVNSQGGTLNYK